MILSAEFSFEFGILLRVEFRRLDEAVEVLIQVRVHELQLGGGKRGQAVRCSERPTRACPFCRQASRTSNGLTPLTSPPLSTRRLSQRDRLALRLQSSLGCQPLAWLTYNVGQREIFVTVDGYESYLKIALMKGTFTAIIEEAPEGGYWAICPEVPGSNGQGETVSEAKKSLRNAIRLILEDRLEDARRGLPDDAIQSVIAV